MASIGMVSEEEAIGRVREIYDDIKATLDIDFVPGRSQDDAVGHTTQEHSYPG